MCRIDDIDHGGDDNMMMVKEDDDGFHIDHEVDDR